MTATISRRSFALAMLGCAMALPASQHALAQGFPTKPVTILVPYSAGSTTDIIARLIAEPLSQRLGQAVVVDNRVGAGGAVAINALKNAAADGHTIGLIASGNVIQPWAQKDVTYDVRTDFENLSLMYAGQYVLSLNPDFPAQNFEEFIEYTKANPTAVFYGSSGVATTTHLAGEMLVQQLGANLTHVPFKGSPEVFAALLGGEIQAYFDLYGSARANIESGAIRPIAVSGLNKLAALPELPTIAEYAPGYNVLAWTGFAAPKGTPAEVVDKLATELRAVMNSPELQAKFAELGVEPGGNTPEEFTRFVAEQYDMWGQTIQTAGIEPQ